MNYLEEIDKLLITGWVKMSTEEEVIEVVQRLRRSGYDMEKIKFDFKTKIIKIS